jgi:hypothetical protein
MSLFKMKLVTVLGIGFAALLFLCTVVPVEAAPPPGMRWSDTAGLTSPRRTSQPTTVSSAVSFPQFSSSAPITVAPAVAAPTSTQATISVRGPDGIVRTYPVEGPVVQQGAPAYIAIQGSDGIVRTYQVVDNPPAAPVVTNPCR